LKLSPDVKPLTVEGYVMKTVAAAVLVLSTGFGLNNVALAEAFNERGEDYAATVQSEADATRSAVIVIEPGFNERGVDYIADAPAGTQARKSVESRRDAAVQGWNS
jgi:hypothetical protein